MTPTFQTYEEAVSDYLAKFDGLLTIPAEVSSTATRGPGDVPIETLIERADGIADVSSNVLELAQPYLASDDPSTREGISAQLVAQAAVELQLAAELLQFAVEEKEGLMIEATTRAERGVALGDAIADLKKALAPPVSAGLATRGDEGEKPTTPDEAKKGLEEAVNLTTDTISQRVFENGSRMVSDLVLQTDWTKVIEAAVLTREGVSKQLGKVKKEASKIVEKAVNAAEKTVLNTYDKILALFGKDVESEARTKIQEWLDKIEKEQEKDKKISVFVDLVNKLYQVDDFKKAMAGCLAKTQAPIDKINQTTSEVNQLSDKFIALIGQAQGLTKALAYLKLIPLPAVLMVYVGLKVGLLTTVVYAGYDYVGYKQVNFLDITKGVAQVVQENLCPEI